MMLHGSHFSNQTQHNLIITGQASPSLQWNSKIRYLFNIFGIFHGPLILNVMGSWAQQFLNPPLNLLQASNTNILFAGRFFIRPRLFLFIKTTLLQLLTGNLPLLSHFTRNKASQSCQQALGSSGSLAIWIQVFMLK